VIPDRTDKRCTAVAHDEHVAKIFVVVGENARRCLACDQLFTKQESFHHSQVPCYPPASNSN